MDTVIELKTPDVIAQAHSGSSVGAHRTKESIDPKISLSIVEIDPQSSQFACEVTIANLADEEFEVVAVRPRLPYGVKLNEAVDSNEVELNRRYVDICDRVGGMLTNAIMATSSSTFENEMKSMQAMYRKSFTFKNIFDIYFSLFLSRAPKIITEARKRQFRIDVTCYDDAMSAFQMFSSIKTAPEYDLILYSAGLLASIEGEEEFERSRNQTVNLKKGQQYKIVYIVNGHRGSFSATSFSISVDMVFQRGDYKVSRMEAATITVPPGPFWLSIIAMMSAAIGSYIHNYTAQDTVKAINSINQYNLAFSAVNFIAFIQQFAVPVLTALIVYNIFDMTSLKNQFSFKRSWRSAILVGFACGFLNAKILTALSVLFK